MRYLPLATMVAPHSNPLAEVFGFPITNTTKEARRYRRLRLCPYNNNVPSCTKDKAKDPLGACSIYENNRPTITCPVRFRENWYIAGDMAEFLFPKHTKWTTLTEVRLNDNNKQSAGNIDLVLVSYDDNGKILDFGALEVQAVYISGNVRRPFQTYMQKKNPSFTWPHNNHYPRPDYLSSSRKRLVPQLLYKGGILNDWGKKIGVALHDGFYSTLPALPTVTKEDADIAWFIYSLQKDKENGRYHLSKKKTIYTRFETALKLISTTESGPIDEFLKQLQKRLEEKIEQQTPTTTGEINLDEVMGG